MTQLIPDKAHFTFDNQIYQQSDVTEKGFPLEPSPADARNCTHTHTSKQASGLICIKIELTSSICDTFC